MLRHVSRTMKAAPTQYCTAALNWEGGVLPPKWKNVVLILVSVTEMRGDEILKLKRNTF